ncbi:MAG: Fic family protein, partial [Mycoplasmataceae bacterium]|nr:Fic family protein [Mycoplasmataceae bacterium]
NNLHPAKSEHIKDVLINEIYYTLNVERESSSRKAIKDIVNNSKSLEENDKNMLEKNLWNAFEFIMISKPNINKQNLNTVYRILTTDIDMGQNILDGDFYRLDDVLINEFKGVDAKLVEEHMNSLFEVINDLNDEDFIYKAILIHFYFETIHPFYDFNGRLGRILVFWYSIKINKVNDLLFFSTSISHYRDQYIKSFNESRKLKNVDATFVICNIIDILIKNKKNYQTLTKIKTHSLDKYNKDLSFIAKDMIMNILSLKDISGYSEDNWIKKSTIDDFYKEYTNSVIYNELNTLKARNIIKISDSRPLKIKFLFSKFE